MSAKMAANGIRIHARLSALTREVLWIEVTAILKHRTALTNHPTQLCVDSSTLAYKKANLFVTTIRVIFDWYLWKLLATGLMNNAIQRKFNYYDMETLVAR